MSKLYRFDVDYLDEERGIKHIPCDNGDYVLAEDALALQARVEKLTKVIRMLKLEAKCTSDKYLRGAILRQTEAALKKERVMSDFNKWWMDHINLSCDRGYPAPNQAAKAAWDHQQATITKMKAQRIAYASEFECDEGLIHENIRTLKATITDLEAERDAWKREDAQGNKLLGEARATITELRAVLQAAFDCGMVPITSAKEGGAARFSEQVRVADRMRAALVKDGE